MNVLGLVFFYFCAALALGGAVAVVLAKNPIRSAMGLLLLILSVAGLFASLHAQFLAAVQLIVYAGAIVVLFLFVIMLLGPSAAPPADGRGTIVRTFGGSLFALSGIGALAAIAHATAGAPSGFPGGTPDAAFGGIEAFGAVLFSDAVAPFELSSALLMVAVIGAIAVARGRQGVHSLSKNERESVELSSPVGLPAGHSGVFSHESAGSAALPDAGLPAGVASKGHSA